MKRNRSKDRVGKGANTHGKHYLMQRLLTAQAAKLHQVFGPGGAIIDMHAHDGEGCVTPQSDMFNDVSISQSSAQMAVDAAKRYKGTAILCESNKARRDALTERFGQESCVVILTSNNRINPDEHAAPFKWVIVFNDPCGHSKHNVDMLEAIAAVNPRTDFIVAINEGSLHRHLAVGDEPTSSDENPRIKACREAKEHYQWMTHHEAWLDRLRKRICVRSKNLVKNGAFHGRVNLFTNYSANISTKEFTWLR